LYATNSSGGALVKSGAFSCDNDQSLFSSFQTKRRDRDQRLGHEDFAFMLIDFFGLLLVLPLVLLVLLVPLLAQGIWDEEQVVL